MVKKLTRRKDSAYCTKCGEIVKVPATGGASYDPKTREWEHIICPKEHEKRKG